MGIYQQGQTPPKHSSEKKVKGLIFENKYFDREEREDGMVVLRPKANVEFMSASEESMDFNVLGEEEELKKKLHFKTNDEEGVEDPQPESDSQQND